MKMVQNFYGRDDISRILTGKKELMEKRETRQKRVLLLKIGEAHELLWEESSVKIGISKFAELQPPQFLPSSAFDHEVCIWKYHENLIFCPMGYQDLTHLNAFQVKWLLHRKYEDDSMSYYQWHKVEGVVKKHLVDCTIAEAKEDLQAQRRPLF